MSEWMNESDLDSADDFTNNLLCDLGQTHLFLCAPDSWYEKEGC